FRNLEVKPDDSVLDIGCGYGPIGIYCAKIATKDKTLMIDKDFVAIEYAQKNIVLNKTPNASASLSNMLNNIDPDLRFSLIVSNLPANVGKDVWNVLLDQAYNALEPGGRI